jgi:hypothetical protein
MNNLQKLMNHVSELQEAIDFHNDQSIEAMQTAERTDIDSYKDVQNRIAAKHGRLIRILEERLKRAKTALKNEL